MFGLDAGDGRLTKVEYLMDASKRRLAIGLVIGSIVVSVFAIIMLATAKPSTFSCSRVTQSCTWVRTNAIGWPSTETFPLASIGNSHIQTVHNRRSTSHVWEIDAGFGHLALGDADSSSELAGYAKGFQAFFDDPTRQTIGVTFEPDNPDLPGYLLIGAIAVLIAAFLWRAGSDIRIVVDRDSRTVRVRRSPWVLRAVPPVAFEGLTIETERFTAYALGEGDAEFWRVKLVSHFKTVFSYKVRAGDPDVDRMREALAA